MKKQIKLGIAASLISSTLLSSAFCVASFGDTTDETTSNIKIEGGPERTSSSYDQIITLQLGELSPKSVQVTNGSYTFNYGSASSLMGQAGWALKLVEFGGAFYFEENVGFSSFGGNSIQNNGASTGGSNYTLDVFGLDSRIMYAADWFPWKVFVPFVDGGYQYSFYFQPGTSGLDSTDGGVGNPVAGAGARIWLNRKSSIAAGGNPIFLSAKVNRVFAASNSLNLESTSFFGGLSLGL